MHFLLKLHSGDVFKLLHSYTMPYSRKVFASTFKNQVRTSIFVDLSVQVRVEAMVRGYHTLQNGWTAAFEEELSCQRE